MITESKNLPLARGDAKAVYRLVKSDALSLDELDLCHRAAFSEQEFDVENDLHVQLHHAVEEARVRLLAAQKAAQDDALEDNRDRAKRFLEKSGVDSATIPLEVLDEVYAGMRTPSEFVDENGEDAESVSVLAKDDDELMLVTDSGFIVSFIDAPSNDVEVRNILEWVGERMTRAAARHTGLMAEKQVWLDRINKQYDPLINKQSRIQERLRHLYTPLAQSYLDEMVAAAKKKGSKAIRSVKVGLLTCAYTLTRESLSVVNEILAIAYCTKKFPEAIKKSILVSLIPESVRGKLDVEKTGLSFDPGGKDKFSLK